MNNTFWIIVIIVGLIQLYILKKFKNEENGYSDYIKLRLSIMLYIVVFIVLIILNYFQYIDLKLFRLTNMFIDWIIRK